MNLPKPTLSASIGGAKTNRVTVQAGPRLPAAPRRKRYLADASVRGREQRTVAICLPVDDLAAIDRAADARQQSRSEYLRRAGLSAIADGGGATGASNTSRSAQHMAARKGK